MTVRNATLPVLALAIGILSAAALGLLINTSPTQAEGPTGKPAVTMTFAEPRVSEQDGQFVVSVKLVGTDGEPISHQPVKFFVTPDFLGERPLLLLTTRTDQEGTATITYTPRWEGEHRITARFAGNDAYEPAEASAVLELPAAPSGLLPLDAEHLDTLRQWATPGVVAVVLIVWSILALVVIRVGWGVWQSSRRIQGPIPSSDVIAAEGRLAGDMFDGRKS